MKKMILSTIVAIASFSLSAQVPDLFKISRKMPDSGVMIWTSQRLHQAPLKTPAFIIQDSTGVLASRDTCGNWTIKDPVAALEVIFRSYNYNRFTYKCEIK